MKCTYLCMSNLRNPFEQIHYFDRLQREKIEMPRKSPLTSIWTKKPMQKRMEIEDARGYGYGSVLGRVPLEQNNGKAQEEAPSASSSGKDLMVCDKISWFCM